MHGTIPIKAFMPNVHTEVEKIPYFQEVGECGGNRIQLSERPMYIPGTSNLGVGVSKQQESTGITVKCAKSLERKQKCLISLFRIL